MSTEDEASGLFSRYGVGILVVVVTAVSSVFFGLRNRREKRAQARRHFVKAASLHGDARNAKVPSEAQSLAHQAIAEADIAIQLDVSDAAYHIVKSLALEVIGSSEAAIKELERALATGKSLTDHERSSTLVKKAELLLSQSKNSGVVQEALLDLRQSVALTPKNARAQLLLGQAYEKEGNISKAIEAFNQAAVLDPKSPDAKVALQRLQVN